MSLSVKIEGLEELNAALVKMPPELRKEQRKAMSRALTIMQDEARQLIHSPAGHASKGIVQRITGSGETVKGRLMPGARPNGLATIFAQQSSRPGRRPPPISAIAKLARSLGINPFALARSIGKKGTKGHPIMREAFTLKKHEAIAVFKAGLEHVVHLAKWGL